MSCVYVMGVLALFSLSVTIFLPFVWLFREAPPFLSSQWPESSCGELIERSVLLTLGRVGVRAWPVAGGLGQMEGVVAQTSALGPLGGGKKGRGPLADQVF